MKRVCSEMKFGYKRMRRAYHSGAGHIICQNGIRNNGNPIELNTTQLQTKWVLWQFNNIFDRSRCNMQIRYAANKQKTKTKAKEKHPQSDMKK